MHDLYHIFCACCLWPWLGPRLALLRYVTYFQFFGHKVGSAVAQCGQSLTSVIALLLSTCADRQRVDISVTVSLFCVCLYG